MFVLRGDGLVERETRSSFTLEPDVIGAPIRRSALFTSVVAVRIAPLKIFRFKGGSLGCRLRGHVSHLRLSLIHIFNNFFGLD